ncbi:hypothetical protein Egran_00348 [Elaphomyces granulatus]|uniref:Carrier domain-containing protein n=1 Tax=Elaphomyces granulatus TaxID=519963 RepID=A0A232M669_9EURO|nr:hypothetical protein Egran_00348 [Elaphomyces granulatus]
MEFIDGPTGPPLGDRVMPIAIVGVGGRFPGDASNPDKLWELLCHGKSAMTEVPKDRFNVDAFYHPQAERAGTQNFRGAHFMDRDPEAFDAPFFSISPNEAKAMDPQQRMCLEVAYEAMENAGVRMEDVVGSDTSCYVGSFTQDYNDLMSRDPECLPSYWSTGTSSACISNRISWFYDLRGPSMTVDTACSSSLVALHLACQSLRAGESKMSLVGGVNFMCSPAMNTAMTTLHFLTPDSKCQTFDEKANGYARGEGTSFVVLKPLNIAIRDNDVIRAVIRNTGSNQDGKTPGITFPSAEAQASLIRKMYEDAALDLGETGYFEAHGTGTAAGDPIETRALGATFGRARSPEKPLWVGSIKPNIGHLEGASGLAGLTKALYVLEKGLIPPQIWLQKANPRIRLEEWNLAIPHKLTPWPYKGLRRVSINSFGFGGTNAHVILDDAYHYMKARGIDGFHNTTILDTDEIDLDAKSDSGISFSSCGSSGWVEDKLMNDEKPIKPTPKLIALSTHEQDGIKRISDANMIYLKQKLEALDPTEQAVLINQYAYTTSERRSILPWKSFAVVSVDGFNTGLVQVAKPVRSSRVPKLGFVFTGQGAQHFSMGRELCAYDEYSNSLRDAGAYLTAIGCPWLLITELSRDEKSSKVNDPYYSQPICTAVQIALVDLLRDWGIIPSAVVGHSSGEIAAAYAKGAITREAALTIAYHRGRLSSLLSNFAPGIKGGMLAAGVGEEAARLYLEKVTNGEAVVACINSPTSVTISGDLSAILQIETMMKADGLFARQLKVETAYHSPHMQVIGQKYLESLSGIQLLPGNPSSPKMFSSVTGELIDNSNLGPEYWVSNMLNTVRFSEAVKALLEHSESRRRKRANAKPYVDVLVELGPHGALQGPIKQILGSVKAECTSLSILHRGSDAIHSALEAVGRLFQQGHPANITAANSPQKESKRKMLVDLPPFSWNHTNKYWHESALASNYRFRKLPRNDLLGLLDDEGNLSEYRWRNFLRLSENPWIQDHSVQNTLLYPAAGMMVMALEAAVQIAKPETKVDGFELRDIIVQNALIIPRDEDGIETMLHLRPWRTGSQATTFDWHEFTIYSRPGKEEWARNCTGLLAVKYKNDAGNSSFTDEEQLSNSTHRQIYERVRRESPVIESTNQFYDHRFESGLQYGDTFRNLIEIHKGRKQSICNVRIPDIASIMPENFIRNHIIHPCTLDTIIQALFPSLDAPNEKAKVAAIPTYIEKLFVSADILSEPGNVLQTYSLVGYTGLKEAEGSVYASVEGWEKPLIAMKRVRLTRLSALTGVSDVSKSKADLRKVTGGLHWQEDVSKLKNYDIQMLCSNVGPNCNPHAAIVSFMRLATHKNPTMKILEIGAGEGAVTAHILNALAGKDGESTPWFKSYLVTDIGQSTIDKINEQFGSWKPYVETMVLRIDQDLTRQGLHSGDYDCIIVTNLSAEAASIDSALANLRTLLKDGGKLVICGTSAVDITGDGWAKDLHAHRFSEIDCFTSYEGEQGQMPSFLLSTALGKPISDIPNHVLIVTAKNPSSQEITLLGNIQDAFQILGISVSTIGFDQVRDISLFEKTCIMLAEVETPLLFEIDLHDFEQLKRIILEPNALLWVTRGGTVDCENPHLALVTGLSRSIRQENFGIPFCTLDLDPKVPVGTETNAAFVISGMRELAVVKGDREFAIREGRMMVPRLHLEQGTNRLISSLNTEWSPEFAPLKQPDRALTLTVGIPGMLDTLFFKDDESYRYPLKQDEIEIEVRATGLNFMDIMVAMDQVQEPSVGVECSGVVTRIGSEVKRFKPGDGVMTWRLGAFSNFIRNAESMFQPIPCDMTYETAASIPIVYVTAYQALIEAARLKAGEKILIHAGAGGVGQAAVMIAKHIGAEIFVTVGSQAKKAHLIENYGIPEDHIFNSRDLTFADGVKRMTDGKGVDVVLNSLAGEALRLSWMCLAWFGRFIELGKKDITGNTGLDMAPFLKNVSFHSVNVIGMLRESTLRASELFEKTMEFIRVGSLQPVLPINVMNYSQIEEGFRLVQRGVHIGKVVFKANDDDMVMALPRPVKATTFDSEATYILSGGLGSLGQELSKWMTRNGARNLAFLSRSSAAKAESQTFLSGLARDGVRAVVYACDIGIAEHVEQAVARCKEEMPPIRGVIQSAMSLADSSFTQMTSKQWSLSVNSKASGTWNLHRFLPKELDFFVMLSSSLGVLGGRGQANYTAGNTFLDALAHYRRAQGLTAVSFDVAPVTGIGYVAEHAELIDSFDAQGHITLKADEFMALFQASISGETINGHEFPVQLVTGFGTGGYMASQGRSLPYYLDDPKMSHIAEVDSTNAGSEDTDKSWQAQLSQISSVSAGADLVAAALRSKLAKQMMVSLEDIDISKPMTMYGVDSLTAAEIRAWSFRDLQSDVSIFDIISKTPISMLARTIVMKSKFVPKEISEADF